MKEENLSREPQSEMKKTVEKKEGTDTDRDDQHDADNCNREVRRTCQDITVKENLSLVGCFSEPMSSVVPCSKGSKKCILTKTSIVPTQTARL